MSYNGSGVFVVNSSGQPVVATTLITAAAFNALTADVASGLSTAICKDGQTTVTANIPFAGFKLTGVGAATARTDAATLASIQDGTGVYVATVGGTADVITLTPAPAIAAYAAGQTFRFIASGANTTNVTVNVSGLGAKAITKNGTTALVAGDIPSGTMVEMTYDGTRFILGTLGAATHITPADNVFRIIGSADGTKKLAIEVDGFTTATTRTLTPPNADLTLPAVTAAGDIPIASASGVLSALSIGAAGTIPISRTASTLKVAYVPALYGSRYGHTYAHGDGAGAGDQTNDWTFTAGGCMDVTGAYWIQTVALTKQSDAAWAVGNNAGLLDTGAVGNSDYYLFVIARSDTGVTDYLMSLSPTAPSMPANYDFKRLIGWFKRLAGVNVLMHTYETEGGGIEVAWDGPTLDINLANTLTTSRRTDAVKVPLNFSVLAHLNVSILDTAANATAYIYNPDLTDLAPSVTAAPLMTARVETVGIGHASTMTIRTSADGLIAARSDTANMDNYRVVTLGFTWARRN